MYFLLLKCVFLHFPIVFVVFQIYVWCTFNMYFLFYQYVFVVFPTIFAFPLYLHLFCCSFKIYFTFSTWFFVFTISICVYFVFLFYISCMCLCSSPKSLKGTAGGQRRPLTWASKKVSFTQWSGGLKGHLSIWKEPICNCKSCIYFLTPTKSHFQAFNLEPVGIFYLLIFHSFVEQTKSLMQNFSDACCVLVGLDQTSPNKIRWYSLSRHS